MNIYNVLSLFCVFFFQALKSSGEVGLIFTITFVLQLVTEAVAKPEKYFTKGETLSKYS